MFAKTTQEKNKKIIEKNIATLQKTEDGRRVKNYIK